MDGGLLKRLLATVRRLAIVFGTREARLRSPLVLALEDAELIVAFAAQSTRGIQDEKVRALFAAVSAIQGRFSLQQSPTAEELSSFWLAYDTLALDLAPLSAQSIRASVAVNEATYLKALLTPTSINAALTVIVFLLCLALQGFWVAGKELVDRADVLDQQKSDLQKKIATNNGQIRRLDARELRIKEKICGQGGCDLEPPKFAPLQKNIEAVAGAKAELDLISTELTEKKQIDLELSNELTRLNERSRPLEDLLEKWHTRARLVCDTAYMRFLCPVDNPKRGEESAQVLRNQLQNAEESLKATSAAEMENSKKELEKINHGSSNLLNTLRYFLGRSSPQVKAQKEIVDRLKQELAIEEARRFRSVVVEVRIIVANIGAYLIAMGMGVLGALTFILRTLSQQLRDHTYVPTSASVSIVRICLGAIAGVFGTLLVPGSDNAFKSLPPLFIPFVFGYGIEILFSLLDRLVQSFTQNANAPKPS